MKRARPVRGDSGPVIPLSLLCRTLPSPFHIPCLIKCCHTNYDRSSGCNMESLLHRFCVAACCYSMLCITASHPPIYMVTSIHGPTPCDTTPVSSTREITGPWLLSIAIPLKQYQRYVWSCLFSTLLPRCVARVLTEAPPPGRTGG